MYESRKLAIQAKTVSGGHFSSESLSITCNFYGSDISMERLETQLTILKMHA